MNVALFVDPLWDPTGEFRCKDSDYRAYTQQDEELEDILYLGAHLSLKHMYTVDDILFDVKWEEGYIGIKYQCHLETCNFEMHVTLVKKTCRQMATRRRMLSSDIHTYILTYL